MHLGFAGIDVGDSTIFDIFNGDSGLTARWIDRWCVGIDWYYYFVRDN